MGKLPCPAGKEMVRFLVRQGFVCVRINGSHHYMEKGPIHTSVPVHKHDLRTGTLRGILHDIRMKPEEFEKLWRD